MSGEPLVFVLLVNWNGKNDTLDCLSTLSKLSYRNFKTVVVDNGSTDGSAEAFREAYPEVVVLELPQNLRFAGGNNAGIGHALDRGAELLLLLNNDTTVDAGFLGHLVTRIQTDATIGIVAPKIYYHDDPGRIWFAGGVVSMWTGTMKHRGIREPDHGQYDQTREIEYASGCCMLIRSQVVRKIGMLDESFYMYTEDADWSMRARRAGYKIVYEPRARVWHKLSVSAGGHLSIFKLRNKLLGNLRFFARYAKWYHWLVFPWLSVLANAVVALRYLVTTRDR